MTRKDEILIMESGNEMDILVAIKVLGYSYMAFPAVPKLQKPSSEGTKVLFEVPKYSSYIAAAWEVINHIIGTTKRRPVLSWCGEAMTHEWHCDLNWGIDAYALTAPLAICRAALLVAMEAE